VVIMAAAIAGAVAQLRAQALSNAIGVSGHWVIEVRNADGSLASRTEFRNHLTEQGAALLARLMGRSASIGTWQISATGARVTGGGALNVIITEASNPPLTLSVPGPATVRLSGESRPTAAVDLREVATGLKECGGTIAATDCARPARQGTDRPFSSTLLPSPIRVAANQTVQVQVDISFSPLP
jgi:hypothetical protein